MERGRAPARNPAGGRIKRRIAVDLPRPRTLETTTATRFNAIKLEVLGLIREESLKAAAGSFSSPGAAEDFP